MPISGKIWQKILIFTTESKSFGTHVTENHLGTFFALFLSRAWNKMGQKCQYLAKNDQKCIFWTKSGSFWAKNPNFYGRRQKFWYQHNKKTTPAPCWQCLLVRRGIIWAKNANIWQNKNNVWPNLAV